MMRNKQNRMKKLSLLCFGAVLAFAAGLGVVKLVGQVGVTFIVVEPVVVETAATAMEKGLNRIFPFLTGSITEAIPFENASETESTTNGDGDLFPDWQFYDFGSAEDDGYGGVVKIYDEGNTLNYVLQNLQTPSETWSGWLTSPDTDQFPAGSYAWNWTIQTSQGTEHWQGNVTVSQQGEDQFLVQGTLQLSDSSGSYLLTISNSNPLSVDALQPALLVSGQATLSFTDPDGIPHQGVWTVTGAGTSRLWVDVNSNGAEDSGEVKEINHDPSTGAWKIVQTGWTIQPEL